MDAVVRRRRMSAATTGLILLLVGMPAHDAFGQARLLKDMNRGLGVGSSPLHPAAISTGVLFAALDDDTGVELWRSDGTEPGTTLVADISPGPGYSSPRHMFAMGDIVYFTAETDAEGRELWRSDGTASGTWLVKDIASGSTGGLEPITWYTEFVAVAGVL